jgi:hypothetical protein
MDSRLIHLWFAPEGVKAIRVDCGSMVGWWPFFRPYLDLKVNALNRNRTDYFIGNWEAVPV